MVFAAAFCAALRASCFGLLLRLEEDRDAAWRFPFGAAAPSDPVFDLWRCELDDVIQGRRSSAFDEALQRVVAAWRDRAPTEADERRRLEKEHLPRQLTGRRPTDETAPGGFVIDERVGLKDNTDRAIQQVERAYLHRLLRKCGGHMERTADEAGISRRTLYSKMKQYSLQQGDFKAPETEEA